MQTRGPGFIAKIGVTGVPDQRVHRSAALHAAPRLGHGRSNYAALTRSPAASVANKQVTVVPATTPTYLSVAALMWASTPMPSVTGNET